MWSHTEMWRADIPSPPFEVLVPQQIMAAFAGLFAALAMSSVVEAGLPGLLQIPEVYANVPSCLNQPSFYSCENTTAIANTCCSPTPGGLGTSCVGIYASESCRSSGTLSPCRSVLGYPHWIGETRTAPPQGELGSTRSLAR